MGSSQTEFDAHLWAQPLWHRKKKRAAISEANGRNLWQRVAVEARLAIHICVVKFRYLSGKGYKPPCLQSLDRNIFFLCERETHFPAIPRESWISLESWEFTISEIVLIIDLTGSWSHFARDFVVLDFLFHILPNRRILTMDPVFLASLNFVSSAGSFSKQYSQEPDSTLNKITCGERFSYSWRNIRSNVTQPDCKNFRSSCMFQRF